MAWHVITAVPHGVSEIRPTRAEIDLTAVRHNAATLADLADTPLYAVVKADAYGHGAARVAGDLATSGHVCGFAVSLVEEAMALRDADIELPVLVMGPALRGGYDALIAHDVSVMVSDLGDLEALDRAARARDTRAQVHLKLDTGMGRLGLGQAGLDRALERAAGLEHVAIAGLCTHFACAETDDPSDPACMTHMQLGRFEAAARAAHRAGLAPRWLHTANSAATLRFPAARKDLVRCGLALYGNGPGPDGDIALRQAMRVSSRIAQLRRMDSGGTVGYGALWRASRPSLLAVIPIGYADGVPRRVTGSAHVLIGGQRCPLVGAISMDISIADVTDLTPPPSLGDEVVLLGRQGSEQILAREYARWAGCTEYEVTCGVSKRVPRHTRHAS